MEKIKFYLAIVILSLLSTFISGYRFAVSDQEIFIPYILKFQDPSLFKGDILFSQFTANASFYYQIMAYITKYINMEIAFFAGFLIIKSILFIGIFKISEAIFKKKEIAILSLLLFLIPKFIGGTGTLTYDDFFGYRSIGVVLYVFYLLFLLKNQFNKASFVAGVCLFFHPLSIIPTIVLAPALILKDSKNKIRDFLVFISVTSIFAVFYQLTFHAESNLFVHSVEWMEIIKQRDSYIFPSMWGIFGWLSLAMFLSLMIFYLKYFKDSVRGTLKTILVVSLGIILLDYLIIEIFQFPGFAKFQLARSITPISTIGLSLSPSLLFFKQKMSKFVGFIAFASLCLNSYYIFLFSFLILVFLTNREKSILVNLNIKFIKVVMSVLLIGLVLNFSQGKKNIGFPQNKTDWISLQIWARDNTAKQSIFLVPPSKTGFRVFSQRTIVGDIKDGAVVIYSESYAYQWDALMKSLKSFENMNETDFRNFKKIQMYDYLVTAKSQKINLPVIYQNNSYTVYKI